MWSSLLQVTPWQPASAAATGSKQGVAVVPKDGGVAWHASNPRDMQSVSSKDRCMHPYQTSVVSMPCPLLPVVRGTCSLPGRHRASDGLAAVIHAGSDRERSVPAVVGGLRSRADTSPGALNAEIAIIIVERVRRRKRRRRWW